MSELKPCPFCGGEARGAHEDYGDTHYWRVYCDTIGCAFGMSKVFHSEAEAIAAWNARAERTCRCTTDDNAWCFACSECGKSFPRSRLHYAYNHGEINYCPNCGAEVVD